MVHYSEPLQPVNIAPLDLNGIEEEKKEEEPQPMSGWQMPADMMAAFKKEDEAGTPRADEGERDFDNVFDQLPGERRPSVQVQGWGKSADEVQPQDM